MNPRSESPAHTDLKGALCEAARSAGWSAQIEAILTDGSRADVLCESRGRKVALEAQVSHQTPREYRSRASRYAATGIESFWFTPGTAPALKAGLPVLPVKNEDHAWTVVDTHDRAPSLHRMVIHPLADVVADLLAGRLRLHSAAAPVFQLVDVMAYGCWRRECDAASVVWDRYSELQVCLRCGQDLEHRTGGELFPQKRPESAPDVIAEVDRWARAAGAPPLAPIELTHSRAAEGSYHAFQCHACRAIIGNFHLRQAFLNMRIHDEPDEPPDRLALPSVEERIFPWHWCRSAEQPQTSTAQAA